MTGKRAIIGGVVVLASIVGLAVASHVAGTNVVDLSQPRKPVLSRALVFRDAAEGALAVFDEGQEKPFEILERDKNRFMATALRLLEGQRARRSKAGPDAPFILTQWNNGQLSFTDPATGETLELGAFGHSNMQTFARLLPPSQGAKL